MTDSKTKKSIDLRPLYIGLLALAFVIPLNMVSGVVKDRIHNQAFAINEVSGSWAAPQNLLMPVLIIPYKETISTKIKDAKTDSLVEKTETLNRFRVILSDEMSVDVDAKTEERRRGIHKVPVYTAAITIQGRFKINPDDLKDVAGHPFLSMAINDTRGISGASELQWNNQPVSIEPGSGLSALGNGIQVPLDAKYVASTNAFALQITLRGVQSFKIVPAANKITVNAQSNWPHPSFTGQFLPEKSDIEKQGFSAQWETGLLATNLEQRMTDCIARSLACNELRSIALGFDLFQPVEIYQKSSRAVRYGLLFVGLTFAIFYIGEILKNIRIHIVQFLLAGGALAVFYLLLVSMSEFIGFGWAYLIAAIATIGLLSFYFCHVFSNGRDGLAVGGVLAVLYATLYAILLSADYALLTGSLLLFFILAGFMYVTRKVDWAALSER